ncbi:MAG: 3,4-dihydroxy-2-butanone-4-phosphate synthase [Thermoplasmata archaeon]
MDAEVYSAIEEIKKGNFVLIYDDDDREKETDITLHSQFVTPDMVARMRTDGGGLICTTVESSIANVLGLPFMTEIFEKAKGEYQILELLSPNDIPYDAKSAFSITINHRKTFTGITDTDRSITIRGFAKLAAAISSYLGGYPSKNKIKKTDEKKFREVFGKNFRSPGHVHLLRTSEHLLSNRKGHTELSTALMILAGLPGTATIVEMMGKGYAKSKEEAIKYAKDNSAVFIEGKQIIEAWNEWLAEIEERE